MSNSFLKLCALCALCGFLFLYSPSVYSATDTRNPTSDEAASGTWSGSAGSRFQSVDDHDDSSCADILTAGTAASDITFGYSAFSIPAGSTVSEVAVLYRDGKTASQAVVIRARLKVSGSYFANGTTHNTTNGGCVSRTDTWSQNPNTTAAWTVTDINSNLQAFGFGCTDCSPTVTFGSIQLRVTYTPPGCANQLNLLGVGC